HRRGRRLRSAAGRDPRADTALLALKARAREWPVPRPADGARLGMLAEALNRLRASAPVVHNITNYVVMNTTANALLAIGASPVMAHSERGVGEMVGTAGALVLNTGTLSAAGVAAMIAAGRAARRRRLPIVLDPVGAGATAYRTESARR